MGVLSARVLPHHVTRKPQGLLHADRQNNDANSNISVSAPEATARWCVADRGAADTTKIQPSSPVALRFLVIHSCSSLLPHLDIRVWPMGHHARSSLLELTKASSSFWLQQNFLVCLFGIGPRGEFRAWRTAVRWALRAAKGSWEQEQGLNWEEEVSAAL